MARTRTSWRKGQSGNAAGMPRGTERKVTKIIRQLSERAAPTIVAGIINDAEAGDANARALYTKYLLPAKPRYSPTPIKLRAPTSGDEALRQIALVAGALARGQVDMDSAHLVLEALKAYLAGIPTVDLETKFRELGLLMIERRELPK
jgi:hypothetical protein